MAGSQYDYGGDRSAVPEQDVTGQILAALMSSKKDQSRLPSARLPLPFMLGGNMPTESVGEVGAPSAPGQPAALPMPGPALAVPGPAMPPDSQAARLPAPAGLVNKPQGSLQRPIPRTRTVNEYKEMLQRAHDAGDDAAVTYFQSQIDKGLAQTTPEGKPIGQSGSILNPIGQGMTFGFVDELAGLGGGAASSLIHAFPETVNAGLGLVGRKLNVDPEKEGFDKGYTDIASDVRQGDADYAERHPYVSAGAEIGSGLALPLSAVRSGASGLRTAVASGAAYGAGKAEGDIGERAKGAATGAAAGGVGYGALRALSGLGRIIFPEATTRATQASFTDAAARLEQKGFRLTAGERLANPDATRAERLSSSYFGVPAYVADRQTQLYRRLMSNSGFTRADAEAGDLSAEALDRAARRFNHRYDTVLRGVAVDLADMQPRLSQMRQAYHGEFTPQQNARVNNIFSEFERQIGTGRQISGEQYKRIYSWLGKLQRSAAKESSSEKFAAPVYAALKENLSDAFRAAVPRAQSSALRAVEQGGGVDAIGTLANRVRGQRLRPNRDFRETLADFQNVFLRSQHRTSMTPEGEVAKSVIPPIMPTVKALGSKGSAATLPLRSRLRQYPRVADALQGAAPFAAGQQAPGSDLEDLVKALGLAVVQ